MDMNTQIAKPRTSTRTTSARRDVPEAQLQEWARRGTEKWRETVATIIAFGQFLIEAKAAAGHGNFSRLFKDHAKPVDPPMPITQRTAEKLMSIAENPVLSNPANWSNLSNALSTLDTLDHLPQEDLQRMIGEGKISPELTQDEAHMLLYCGTVKAQAAQAALAKVKAYQKKLARRAVAECLCQCVRCGSVHSDQRLLSQTQQGSSHENDGKGD
ncbi:MAG: hypothetical protein HZB34_07775 [Nitrospirae bacterium]|nr:hypothetical protein [Nitrospirota bacterium]